MPDSRAWAMKRRTTPASFTPSADVGSSRMTTFAPKWIARAIATDWRSPPESVPTGCDVSRRSIPIPLSASRVTRSAVFPSYVRSGPRPFVGSDPRKKFRLMLISGIIARSW